MEALDVRALDDASAGSMAGEGAFNRSAMGTTRVGILRAVEPGL